MPSCLLGVFPFSAWKPTGVSHVKDVVDFKSSQPSGRHLLYQLGKLAQKQPFSRSYRFHFVLRPFSTDLVSPSVVGLHGRVGELYARPWSWKQLRHNAPVSVVDHGLVSFVLTGRTLPNRCVLEGIEQLDLPAGDS